MGEYRRLISYIYSYEKGVKTKNSGFAKIESRNGVCKLNISLRISEVLMNEAEDNALDVFLFYRKSERTEKIFLGRIRIVSGCSEFKLQMNSEKIGSQEVSLSEISGIFICSRAFLHKNSQLNIIYASEWDDIPIDIDAFTEENLTSDANKVLQDNEKKDYNKGNNVIYEQSEIRASEIDKAENKYEAQVEITQPQEIQLENVHPVRTGAEEGFEAKVSEENLAERTLSEEPEEEGILSTESDTEEPVTVETGITESDDSVQDMNTAQTLEDSSSGDDNTGIEPNEIDQMPDCESCKQQLKEMLSREQNDKIKNKAPDTGDYFKMLCNCYPKIKVDEINGECIKITPHDISYLPKKYWHLCNNSFLLHGFYNYKYLLLCEKTMDDAKRYMICVPGMFHNKEQSMARMFGFTEFEGGQQNGRMNFGYWCMYL